MGCAAPAVLGGALQLVTSCQFSELSDSPSSTAVAGHIDRHVRLQSESRIPRIACKS